MRLSTPILFCTFCLLLAGRDVYTGFISQDTHASFLLFFYCMGATILASFVYGLRTGVFNILQNFAQLTNIQKKTFLNLGLATCVVYGATILGIFNLNVPVFAAVDYGAMPIAT